MQILAAKWFSPALRPQVVARTWLIQKLNQGG
jgi:hypothetical protein